MLASFSKAPISRQIVLATGLLLGVMFTISILLLHSYTTNNAVEAAKKGLEEKLQVMTGSLDGYYGNVKDRGDRELRLFLRGLPGQIQSASGMAHVGAIELPLLKAGEETLNGNHALLEKFKAIGGSEATILSLANGKVYRAASTEKIDGKSLEGSTLNNADPLAQALSKGEIYAGLSYQGAKIYFNSMQPIKDASGRVIGGATVSIDIEPEMAQIRGIFNSGMSGKTGSLFIIRPTGDDRVGEFLLHPLYQGKTVQESLPPDQYGAIQYLFVAKQGVSIHDDMDPRDKQIKVGLSAFRTSQSWNWVVGIGGFLDEFTAESRTQRNILIGLICIAMVFFLVRSRLQPLRIAVEMLERLGAGDLTIKVPDTVAGSTNEMHLMANSLGKAITSMRSMMDEVTRSSQQLMAAAADMESASKEVLDRTQTQASETASMAAAVEELTVSINHVADNAREAAGVTHSAQEATRHGRKTVEGTVTEMERIAAEIRQSAGQIQSLGDRSKQISAIIGVIKDIADQTNLLALNAAIEAARAGEQGRGFAVVADEVRKLAERTTHSTQEISETIAMILGETDSAVSRMKVVNLQVEQGVALAREAGSALGNIEANAHHTVTFVGDIATATREQGAASTQMAQMVERVSHMTEENAAAVHHNSERAGQLRELAGHLQGILGRFHT